MSVWQKAAIRVAQKRATLRHINRPQNVRLPQKEGIRYPTRVHLNEYQRPVEEENTGETVEQGFSTERSVLERRKNHAFWQHQNGARSVQTRQWRKWVAGGSGAATHERNRTVHPVPGRNQPAAAAAWQAVQEEKCRFRLTGEGTARHTGTEHSARAVQPKSTTAPASAPTPRPRCQRQV